MRHVSRTIPFATQVHTHTQHNITCSHNNNMGEMTPAMLLNCSGRFGWWRHTEHSVADAPQLCTIFLEGKATRYEVWGFAGTGTGKNKLGNYDFDVRKSQDFNVNVIVLYPLQAKQADIIPKCSASARTIGMCLPACLAVQGNDRYARIRCHNRLYIENVGFVWSKLKAITHPGFLSRYCLERAIIFMFQC